MLEAFQRYWHGDQEEIQLLLDLHDPEEPRRHKLAAAGSVAAHGLVALIAILLPAPPPRSFSGAAVTANLRRATPLIAPRLEEFKLTQKEKATAKPALEVDLASLLPKPAVQSAPARPKPGTTPSGLPAFAAPGARQTAQSKMVEAPAMDWNAGQPLPASAAPQIRTAEPPPPPKPAFERLGSAEVGPPTNASGARLEPPKANVQEAMRQVARGAGGAGLTVGDVGMGSGGYSDPLNQSARPAQNFGTLQLLSDPQGVDFRPYLIQVLAAVKRNWMAVLPESARFGRSGRVAIQFAIARNGYVPKLVIASPSGAEALDRAGVAGISASTPFPPLPAEFKGVDIRLQLVFTYNMPK
jgi:TonB family protein